MVKMIVDNFMFFEDIELLELRYHMLKDVVDVFVISEANHSFTGIPKQFCAWKSINELGLDVRKFIVLEVDTSDDFLDTHPIDIENCKNANDPQKIKVFSRQRKQRDAIMSILDTFSEDTIFCIGDVDEIPKPDAVKYMASVSDKHVHNIIKIPLVLLESRADRRLFDNNNDPVEWNRSLLFCRKNQLADKGPTILRDEFDEKGEKFKYHPVAITENYEVVKDLGWHFTWMGGKERKLKKSKSCAHSVLSQFVNNVSNETKTELKTSTPENFGSQVNYTLKPYDVNLLPPEIFQLQRVKNFLLPEEKKPKLVDYFMYFNERELLELRYHMLKDHVDLFVISESNLTFSGQPKHYNLDKVIDELKLDRKKIRVLRNDLTNLDSQHVNYLDQLGSNIANDQKNVLAWTRERLQRDAITNIINEFDDDCVFIVSDIDEIIKPDSLPYFSEVARGNPQVIVKIPLVLLESRADKRMAYSDGNLVAWEKSMFLCTKTQLAKEKPHTIRGESQQSFPVVYVTENGKPIVDLGWHFTWMGNQQRQKIKATSYGHAGNLDVVNTLSQDTVKSLEKTLGKAINLRTQYKHVDYPLSSLPKEIFSLPNVERFLLPKEVEDLTDKINQQLLIEYINDPHNPLTNFNLGYDYERLGQTAAAVSFYLRSAEKTDDTFLQYECFLRLARCFELQKNRNYTVTGLFHRAITIEPTRPEAYFFLAKHHLDTGDHQSAFLYSTIGMSLYKPNDNQFVTKVNFVDINELLYVRAISGWYVGFYNQSKKLLLELQQGSKLSETYQKDIEKFLQDVVKNV
jgi:beta-1,4-mannosyl-glycoprotein beta-1,4-N-acetylglucosaminyltransferase